MTNLVGVVTAFSSIAIIKYVVFLLLTSEMKSRGCIVTHTHDSLPKCIYMAIIIVIIVSEQNTVTLIRIHVGWRQ